MVEIVRYTPSCRTAWDEFVALSKQGTFLLFRHYMDYHRDRFVDHSLMVFRDGTLCALLPANETEGVLWSHGGLTYGGLLTTTKTTAVEVCEIFRHINIYLGAHGIHKVIYKAIPWIYHRIPAEEDLYAIVNVCHARLTVRNIASVVMQETPVKWNRDRRYGANKANTDGVTVERSENDLEAFWEVLTQNLQTVYNALPVHDIEEMQRLRALFPDNIILYVAKLDGQVLGGTLLYVTPQVVHAQYISATAEGKRRHAIDAIFRKVLTEDFATVKYFDFGTSNEEQGRVLNESLIYQKEGFGGRGICYDRYEWDVQVDG